MAETTETQEVSQVIQEEQAITKAVQSTVKSMANPKHKYHFGRKVIRIPLSRSTLNENTISGYLPYILGVHVSNVAEVKHLRGIYTGETAHIWDKERKDSEDNSNVIIEEGHAYSMVEFKKGYLYGEDVSHSYLNDTECNDDLTYFNRYMEVQSKASKNVDMAEDVYIGGSGIRFILPSRKGPNFNPLVDSPFEIYNLDYDCSFIVYSSNYTREKLFGGIITTIDSTDPNNIRYELMIYDHQYAYVYSLSGKGSGFTGSPIFIGKTRHYMGMCNFVEYRVNKSRIGIIERVETLFDAINDVSSYSIDNVIDFVNAILVIYNQKMSKKAHKEVNKNKAMVLQTNDPSRPADAKYLVNALNLEGVQTKYEAIVTLAYNIVGVPQATTKTTSGGDTGDARELGGGWTRADEVAKQEEKGLLLAEREMVEICLNICKMTPGCPIITLNSSDIDIVFNRSNRDNLLVKMQALKYGYDMNMPKEPLLNIVNVTSNSHEVAHKWEDEDSKKKEENGAAKKTMLPQDGPGE